jgi:hypothetical protein
MHPVLKELTVPLSDTPQMQQCIVNLHAALDLREVTVPPSPTHFPFLD